MKFVIGQSVKVKTYDRWVGDYEIPGTIIGYGNVFINGIQTYVVKTYNQKIWNEVSEQDIVL